MNTFNFKLALSFSNFLFALILSSIGVVILQLINHSGVPPSEAGVLEAFKDIPLAIASFSVATLVPGIGYKKTMLTALFLVIFSSMMMALTGEFIHAKLFFLLSGIGFGLFKVAGYPSISLVAKNSREHAGFMSFLEAMFMVGVLCSFLIFGWFIRLGNEFSFLEWTDIYWVLAFCSILAFLLMWSTAINEDELLASKTDSPAFESVRLNDTSPYSSIRTYFLDLSDTIRLIKLPLVLFFCLGIGLYVYVEQALNSWLPSFNHRVLHLPESVSVQLGMIYGGTLALGRFLGGWSIKRWHWFIVLEIHLICAITVLFGSLFFAESLSHEFSRVNDGIPLAAWILPITGFFLAPMYPTLSSTVLTSVPLHKQSKMTSLIVLFSALGGTTGSITTGTLFGTLGGLDAIRYLAIPLIVLILLLIPYKKAVESKEI